MNELTEILRDTLTYAHKKHDDIASTAMIAGMVTMLNALEQAIEEDATEAAVLLTARIMADLQTYSVMFELPSLFKRVRSIKQSNNAKDKGRLSPNEEHSLDCALLHYCDECKTPQALYKECAKLIYKDQSKFKKIKHRVSALYPSVKSPY